MYLFEVTRRQLLQVAAAVGSSLFAKRLRADTASFLRQPNVQELGGTSAALIWTLPYSSVGSVEVVDPLGRVQGFLATVRRFDAADTGMAQTYYQYQALLDDLRPATTYSYRVLADGKALICPLSRPLQFRTAEDVAFRFLHFADSGEGNTEQLRLALQMAREDASLVLANGDLAYNMATHDSVEANYYGVYREQMAQIPFFATLGNHEYYTDAGGPSLAARVTPRTSIEECDRGRYYSFDWGNVHFVALDSNAPLNRAINGTGAMLDWLDRDLGATRQFWRIAFFHHPGYATGKHQDEPEAGNVRKYIVPILEKHGVQLVFNGHEHNYQRTFELSGGRVVPPNSGGIVYVTSGGGGAATYPCEPSDLIAARVVLNHYVRSAVAGPRIVLEARGLDREKDIDATVLSPLPRIEGNAVNAASFTPDLASGGAIAIFGRNLASAATAAGSRSPLKPVDCAVLLNGSPIPLLFADALQINAQIPFSFRGNGILSVVTPNGKADTGIHVDPVAPALFTNPDGGTVLAMRPDGSTVTADAPAHPLEAIRLQLTGLGAVRGIVQAGTVPPRPVPVVASVQVMFGDLSVPAISAVLSTDAVGAYAVDVQVPDSIRGTSVAVKVIADGVPSNTATLPVG